MVKKGWCGFYIVPVMAMLLLNVVMLGAMAEETVNVKVAATT